MRCGYLLREQEEELHQTFEDCKVNDPERVEGYKSWYDWELAFSFTDDDFFCTANRNRYYHDICGMDLDESEIRALEYQESCILDEDAVKVVLERTMREMIEKAVRDYEQAKKEGRTI